MKRLTILLLSAAVVASALPVSALESGDWTGTEQLDILTGNTLTEQEETKRVGPPDSAIRSGEAYAVLNRAGVIPLSMAKSDLSGAITRLEFCEMIVPLYEMIAGVDSGSIELVDAVYDDCDSLAAAQAYSLGFIAIKEDGLFDPTGLVTRQEMAVALISMLETAGIPCGLSSEELQSVCGYEDFADADSWAYNGIAKAVSDGFMSGTSETDLLPLADATRGEMLQMTAKIYNAYLSDRDALASPAVINPEQSTEIAGSFAVNWSSTDNAKKYHLFVTDITKDCVLEISTRGTSAYIDTGYFVDGESYKITVAAEYENGGLCYSAPTEVVYLKPRLTSQISAAEAAAKESRAFDGGARYATEEEAAANMRTVTVPVWRLAADGTKYESKQSVTVNKNLADDVVAIFTEIFEDESRFPIKDIGCYCWRNTLGGAQSQHSFGTCIDINYNENYYVSASGKALTGSFWKPYENPYSITPDGIVVKTFAKYGWLWAGTAWGDGYAKDYMHMTYLGG